ncbi:GD15547 [Drosophila simulans]|uniref:GD15547 n=1 Tax=Drosophila simulans TaxID=7240 RepID=B4R2W9_DROSI|nr:GD15547 [Drosophila simulans]
MCNSWLVLIIALSVVVCLWNSQQTETSKSCPAECICLSQTQTEHNQKRHRQDIGTSGRWDSRQRDAEGSSGGGGAGMTRVIASHILRG